MYLRDHSSGIICEAQADPAAPFVLKGIKICGLVSNAGFRYSDDVLRDALPLYEGAPLCLETIGHKKNNADAATHIYEHRLGLLSKPEVRPGQGLFGNATLNPGHPLANTVKWDFEQRTPGVGLSHIVDAIWDAHKNVTKINSVKCVDIAMNPSTTGTLCEATEDEPAADEMLLHIQALTAHPAWHEYMANFAKGLNGDQMAEALQLDARIGKLIMEASVKPSGRPIALRPSQGFNTPPAALPTAPPTLSEIVSRLRTTRPLPLQP